MKIISELVELTSNFRNSYEPVFTNVGWISVQNLLKIGIGLVVTVWIARYLGPAYFGKLNFALTLMTFFGALSSLGLYGIVSRDLMSCERDPETTLGTAFCLHLLGGMISLGLMVAAVQLLRPEDTLTIRMVIILGLSMPFQAVNVIRYFLEAKVRSHVVARIDIALMLAFSAIRVVMLLMEADILVFVWLMAAQAILGSILLPAVYMAERGSLEKWKVSSARAVELMREASPLFLSSIAMLMYTRIDQLMVAEMIGDRAIGIYAAASNISSIWHFFPLAIIASFAPTISKARAESNSLYLAYFQKLFDGLVLIAVAVAAIVSIAAIPLIQLLYGDSFQDSSTILTILMWSGVPSVLIFSSGRWYIFEGLQKLVLMRNIFGMAVCILLNLLLIPMYQGVGAALSTLMAVFSVAFLFDTVFGPTRVLFRMKLKSLNFPSSIGRLIHSLEKNDRSDSGVS